jgi:hypothetical protein
VSFSLNINDFINFTSIGSGGILELSFATGLADRDIVGDFDMFLFEVGAARDNAFYQVDIETTQVPEPAALPLLLTALGGLGIVVARHRRQERTKR